MEYRPLYRDDLYLAHYGIKGQKWGVRRYQNADGSYTSAGKARYNEFGSKKRGLTKSQQAALSAAASVALYAGVIGGGYYISDAQSFDRAAKALTGPKITDQIIKTKSVADSYFKTADAISNNPEYAASFLGGVSIKSRMRMNLLTADQTLSAAESTRDRLEQNKMLLKVSKRRRNQLETIKNNINELSKATSDLHAGAKKLNHELDEAEKRYWASGNQQRRSSYSYRQTSGNQNNYSSRGYSKSASKTDTSRTKSTDRASRMKSQGVKVGSAAEESKNVKYWAKKVADAQKDGTLTADMVEKLQNAKARKKIAVDNEQIKHGFICFCRNRKHIF